MSAPSLPISRRENGALEWSPVPVTELRPNERNPRSISRQRFDDLVYSLREDPDMLQARPIVALPDGRVIMGNMRLRAAIELGWETIPTMVVDLDETRAAQWLVRDNVPYGEWEEDGLAELMYELNQAGSDMRLTGYDASMIKKLLQSVAPDEADPAGGPGTSETPAGRMLAIADVTMQEPTHAVERGQVWRVGQHVLVCAGVYDGWPVWSQLLVDGVLLVPYPSPAAPLSSRAHHHRLLLVQPDTFVCGHLLDSYATLADDGVALVEPGEDPWGG